MINSRDHIIICGRKKEKKKTNFAGGFAGSLAGGAAAVMFFSLARSEEALFEVEERLSFKSTAVSEKTLFPVLQVFLSVSFPLSGRPSRNSVSSKLIILYLSRSASIRLVILRYRYVMVLVCLINWVQKRKY